ncbi:MAG: alcohol dehydrogenase catalytic domain-containing protein [Paraburkholderia sp.]|nr:alcohol dehydrogenase catalytic domain-containing protein [Paraburkholderia sp.]
MYARRTDFEQGRIFGHEHLGVVQEVGPAVERIKPGDRVRLPFNVSCGHCVNCERGLTAFCPSANQPGIAGGRRGWSSRRVRSGDQVRRTKWRKKGKIALPYSLSSASCTRPALVLPIRRQSIDEYILR